MEVREFLAVLARRWALVVGLVVLCGVAAVGGTSLIAPTYQSGTELFVSTRLDAGGVDQDRVVGTGYAADRMTSYASLASSAKVQDRVSDQLRLELGSGAGASEVSAAASEGSLLIGISVVARSPQVAAATADATGDQLAAVIEELEASVNGGVSLVEVVVLSAAVVPGGPVSPNLPLNVVVGVLAGIVFGVALALLVENLDTRVRDAEGLARVTDLPVLATVVRDPVGGRSPIVDGGVGDAGYEAFRQLRTNLRFTAVGGKSGVVVVTSAVFGEGRTSVVGNLGMVLAGAGVRVCVVDGDLRRPMVAECFGLVGEAGLSTVLSGQATIDEVLQPVVPGLVAITSGVVPPNPTELLASERTGSVLRELAQRYEVVLVDAPPILPVADAAVLAAGADGVVYVVHSARTTRHQVGLALQGLEQVQARVLGVVLNMAPQINHNGRRGYSPPPPPKTEGPAASTNGKAPTTDQPTRHPTTDQPTTVLPVIDSPTVGLPRSPRPAPFPTAAAAPPRSYLPVPSVKRSSPHANGR